MLKILRTLPCGRRAETLWLKLISGLSTELFRTLQNSLTEEFWPLQNKSINPSRVDLVWSSVGFRCMSQIDGLSGFRGSEDQVETCRAKKAHCELQQADCECWQELFGAMWELSGSPQRPQSCFRGVGRVTGYRWYSRVQLIDGRPSSSSLSRNRMSWSVAQRAAPM